MDSLPNEPRRKPKNTGVGSLSLLQQIFLAQESNQGLLHYKWILYQLSYQGSPGYTMEVTNRFKRLNTVEWTECLKNYGQRFITLYRRQWTKPPQRKRNARSKVVVWGGFTNSWGKKRSEKQGKRRKIYPTECRIAEKSKERWEGFFQLCSFHMLIRLCSKSFKLGFSSTWTKNFQVSCWV